MFFALSRQSSALQQRLQYVVGRDVDGVLETLLLQHAVKRRGGKFRVTAEVFRNVVIPVSFDDRQKNSAPEVGAVLVATPPHGPFQVAVLVEHEQRMIARVRRGMDPAPPIADPLGGRNCSITASRT